MSTRMARGRWWAGAVLAGWLLGACPPLLAQASAPVPLEDRAYRTLDRLAAELPPEALMHGQRPLTRLQFAALVDQMRSRLDEVAGSDAPPPEGRLRHLSRQLELLEGRFAGELARIRSAGGDEGEPPLPPAAVAGPIRADLSFADSPFRGFAWNGLGWADNARVNPLLDYRHGRELVDGGTVALEADGRLRLGSRLVAFGSTRVAWDAPRGGAPERVRWHARSAAVRGTLGGWALQVGRGHLRRGQGRHAGLLLSANAPPLDMVHLEREAPFRLPWILGRLGPGRFSAFMADLGPDQNFPGAKLYGNWLTFRPGPRLEVGGGFVLHHGGRGAPDEGFWRRLADYLLLDPFWPDGGLEGSNKIAGLDFRLWLPEAGAVVYGEMHVDDLRASNWTHVREMLWPDAAHLIGVHLPGVDRAGRVSAWAEYHHTGVRIYRHYDFSSGVTRGRFLLGSGLGSDAQAVTGGVDWWAGRSGVLSLEAAWEERRHDEWTVPMDPHFHFRKVADNPREGRLRLQVAWDARPLDGGLGWRLEAGAERVRNFDFQEGAHAANAALRLIVEWAPDR